MKIFLVWSGEQSQLLAEAIHEWLPFINPAFNLFISKKISKGAIWADDLTTELDDADAGIVCVTPDSQNSRWLFFETGALSKRVGRSKNRPLVCPYLLRVKKVDLQDPLNRFMTTKAEQQDTRELVLTLNRACGEDALDEQRISKVFDKWWPDLDARLAAIPETVALPRSDREILDEIWENSRFLINLTQEHMGLREDARVDVAYEELERIKAAAKAEGIPVEGFIRRTLLDALRFEQRVESFFRELGMEKELAEIYEMAKRQGIPTQTVIRCLFGDALKDSQ